MSKKLKKSSSKVSKKNDDRELPEIRSLSELKNKNSFLVYGRSGTGKTTFASTFPGDILLLDVKDRGTDSLDEDENDNVSVMEIEHWDDIELVYWHLKKNHRDYGTVVIDTLTQLQTLAVIKVLEEEGKSTKDAGGWGSMRKQDWGTVASMMKKLITDFRNLPLNVVFLAQERTFNIDEEETDNEEALAPEIGPRLSPSVKDHVCAEVYAIVNTFVKMVTKKVKNKETGKTKEVEKAVYCLRLGPNPYYITKIRKHKSISLPSSIQNPTYDSLLETVKPE